MVKKIIIFVLISVSVLILISFLTTPEEQPTKVTQDQPISQETEKIKIQIADTERKIEELPNLEKDIFTKCMEGKQGTAKNIKACEETTQKQIFTLSQDLINLKKSLEEKLKE